MLMAATAGSAIALTVTTLAVQPAQLSWSPYPALTWPPFEILPGLAALSLLVPAMVDR
jgi:energy-coupling factor transport system permease protein